MNARRESKERNLTWRIQEDSNCWTLLEHLLELNLCMLYVVLKLRKSAIQPFKRYTIWSWNEEVGAIGSRLHQAKGQFCRLPNHKRMAAKSAFGCEIISQPSCSFAKFRSHFVHLRNSLECFQIFATNIFLIFCFRYLMSKSQFSPCNPPIIGFLSC